MYARRDLFARFDRYIRNNVMKCPVANIFGNLYDHLRSCVKAKRI